MKTSAPFRFLPHLFATLVSACFFSAALASCTSPSTSGGFIGPTDAIFRAAAAAPAPVCGVFAFQVQAAGQQDGNVYLNSESDYHDQRNLTVALYGPAIAQLQERYGASPQVFFIGKQIVVRGGARRVKITFIGEHGPTDKYYYQTHIVVVDANQLTLAGSAPGSAPPACNGP